MPIDFGTQGREIPGVGVLLSGDEKTLLEHQRKMQMSRMARPRQRGTERESERIRAYIYNVGPFMRKMETLGSIGVVVIPGLEEPKVLSGMSVAGPHIVPGLPAEPYPGEPRGQWLEHDPNDNLRWTDADGEVFSLKEFPGIDLALRIIGGHEQSQKPVYCASPFQQGCFVSTIPEQHEPKTPREPGEKAARDKIREYEKAMIGYEDEVRLWNKWRASWNSASARFTEWSMRRGEDQCLDYANGRYVRDEELFVLSRVFKKTVQDWPFLAGVSANVRSKGCWSCGTAIAASVTKCPNCHELQVTQREHEARRDAVLAGAAA